ncbi:thiamine transport system ATP-binding protein [Halogranum gelatinilyticum]|uniref:Molybdate/tungstate import ATP-binding protein WtpC n=1 Tax=Halogranum gelatinilyticum TaxID=660521 RepID=A0A1G9NWW3_9EURY|nr:ABC transporter ATP-binding protein [Halogranum gelatinilyticum]SDL90870.1 thiamine transport system ATP-binding protein [Halogranum gelatinilyticum]
MSEIHLDAVSKRYGETTALRDVDLDVADGEFFTLVGPSGCGKTTTLRLVAGFESPTEGRVRFDDEDVSGVPPEARGVGVVFQNYALFPHMSVAENVGYGLRFSDPPGDESKAERVEHLLDLVDLDGMGDREPGQLSGGQQQRVALARALAPGPRLLLLDEPMSALDAQLRERLRLQVKEIQSELGITTLYVTHDQEEALAVSDRVAVMHDGRVEQVGTPRDVYHRPETRFVAEFVGDNNVFEGTVTELSVSPDETEGSAVRVNVGGETVRLGVDPAEPPAVGDAVTFCVRPEQLRVGSGENRFTATVERTEFLGEATRVHLDWDGRSVLLRTTGGVAAGDVEAADSEVAGVEAADSEVVGVEAADSEVTDVEGADVQVGFDADAVHWLG